MNNQKQTVFARVCLGMACAILLVCGGFDASAAVDPITGAEPAEGYGASATGGHGKPVVNVTTWSQFTNAIRQSNVYIKLQNDITASGNGIGNGSNITIDGQGIATIWGTGSPSSRGQRAIELTGSNLVLKDFRVRQSGDNISFKSPGRNILVSHVSSTAAYDDGMSISYGTRDVTVQYCAFFGSTRSVFIKYNTPQNISFHHNWIKGQYMRGPLISTAYRVDVRNHLGEDWWSWGGPRFEAGSTGNCVNSTFVMTGAAPGKTDAAFYGYQSPGPIYQSGNVTRGCSGRPNTFTSNSPITHAPITPETAAVSEAKVRASAGCLPRDAIDQLYISTTSGWGRSPYSSMGEEHPWVITGATVTGPASPASTTPIVFTINFTGPVTGLTAAGITVTNGTKGALSGSGAGPYTLQVTPTAPGVVVTCKVNGGAAHVASSLTRAGTTNAESNTLSVTYMGTGEEVPIATVTGPASPTSASPILFEINFSKPVTGFTAAGITVTNGAKGTLTGSGAGPYILPVTPLAPGVVTCVVNGGAAESGDGTGNIESNILSVTFEAPDIPDDLSTWAHRTLLHFAGFTGSEALTSFPLLVRLNAADFPPEDFEPGGADLRFTDADDNPIPYEIEAWDRDGESSIWVTVPQIASNTDYIQMLWGKPGAFSRSRPYRVWTNDFLGVWHLGDFDDSTVAERHATNNGTTSEDGIIGAASDFDGSSFISLPPAGNSGIGSMSFWMKTSTSEERTIIFYLRAPGATTTPGLTAPGRGYGSQHEMHVDFIPTGTGSVALNLAIEGGIDVALDVRATAEQTYADDQWRHVAATWEKPGTCYLYVDGEVVASAEHVALVYDITQFAALGKPEEDSRYYTGLMDEARLCGVARSADWVRASYLNQKRDSTFVLFGDAPPVAGAKEWGGY